MSKDAKKRLQADFKKISKDPPPGVVGDLCEDNLFEWNVLICGPGDTCFEGGIFRLKMKFSPNYPYKAPKVWFYSRMFHPNVYPNGKICLDILEMEDKWKSEYDASAVLCGIQAMLGDPNPDSPANGEANSLYKRDKNEYERRVRQVVSLSDEDEDNAGNEWRNLNVQDENEELAARVQELDITGIQGDPEQIRNFLSQF